MEFELPRIKSLDELAKSMPEEKRSELYKTILEFYILGVENANDILQGINSTNVAVASGINIGVMRYLEERCKENKPYIPKFIYHL